MSSESLHRRFGVCRDNAEHLVDAFIGGRAAAATYSHHSRGYSAGISTSAHTLEDAAR
jgi:hypothetical protein